MTIAVDKNNINEIKNIDKNDLIYIIDDEDIGSLINLGIKCVNIDYIDYVDINTTDYIINCRKQAKITEKDWNILPPKKDYKIGIIVPNYNYSHTLRNCLLSIANQTYKNYEVIYVDDMSTDNSVEIAKEFKGKLTDLKIVQLKQKRFNGGARNEAYLHLSNDVDYVWYVDSDDWLFNNYSLEMINDNLQKEPDVLFVGLASCKNGKMNENCRIPRYKDKYEAIKGWSGSSGKVIKKSLATRQECLYNEGTLKEDRNQHCKICIYMKSFDVLSKPVYVWNQSNMKSVTTIREKVFWGTSTIRHYADTLQLYLSEKGKDPKIDRYLEQRVKNTKEEMEKGGDQQW